MAGDPQARRRHPSSPLSAENRRMAGSGPSCRMAGVMHRGPLDSRGNHRRFQGKSPLNLAACLERKSGMDWPRSLAKLSEAGDGLYTRWGRARREFLPQPGEEAGRPQFPVLEGSQHAQDLRGRAYPQVLVAGMMLIMVRRAGTAKVWAGSPQQARLCRVSAARGYPGGWLARARSDSFAG